MTNKQLSQELSQLAIQFYKANGSHHSHYDVQHGICNAISAICIESWKTCGQSLDDLVYQLVEAINENRLDNAQMKSMYWLPTRGESQHTPEHDLLRGDALTLFAMMALDGQFHNDLHWVEGTVENSN